MEIAKGFGNLFYLVSPYETAVERLEDLKHSEYVQKVGIKYNWSMHWLHSKPVHFSFSLSIWKRLFMERSFPGNSLLYYFDHSGIRGSDLSGEKKNEAKWWYHIVGTWDVSWMPRVSSCFSLALFCFTFLFFTASCFLFPVKQHELSFRDFWLICRDTKVVYLLTT